MKLVEFFWDDIGLNIGGVILLAVVMIYGLSGLILHLGLPAERIEIEQVRVDVARVGCSAAEDAVGLVIAINRSIKSNQFWAHHWLTGLAIPNGWDEITVIEIPDCQ